MDNIIFINPDLEHLFGKTFKPYELNYELKLIRHSLYKILPTEWQIEDLFDYLSRKNFIKATKEGNFTFNCPDCIPEAPFDFEGITGCPCFKHNNNWCMCSGGANTHVPKCPNIKEIMSIVVSFARTIKAITRFILPNLIVMTPH